MQCVFLKIMQAFNLYFSPLLFLFLLFFVLPPGKPAEDEVKLGSLKLKPNTKIMMMGTREESLVGGRKSSTRVLTFSESLLWVLWVLTDTRVTVHVFCFVKEDVLAPPPENDDVVNDFDIEEEVIEVENRSVRILENFKENVRVCVRLRNKY